MHLTCNEDITGSIPVLGSNTLCKLSWPSAAFVTPRWIVRLDHRAPVRGCNSNGKSSGLLNRLSGIVPQRPHQSWRVNQAGAWDCLLNRSCQRWHVTRAHNSPPIYGRVFPGTKALQKPQVWFDSIRARHVYSRMGCRYPARSLKSE